MQRLTVVSVGADRELDAIRQTIDTFENASGLDDVVAILSGHLKRSTRTALLDVIGHSRLDGFLVIGTWVIDDSTQTAATFSEVLRPPLVLLGVRTIRLLGCSTAATERGRNAIRRIAQAVGCEVLGTKHYIGKQDYAPIGFISDDMLVRADGERQ